MPLDLLLVFIKAPKPGAVKTRLIPALGQENAAALYRILAEEEVRRTTPRRAGYARLFFYTPSDARAEMEGWFPGEEWLPQQGEDLGARMAAAFDEAFRRGARRAAIIGSDVPWVSRRLVGEALRLLDEHDLVLGPAQDGGYYLLALGASAPGLFRGIAWGTPSVLAATVERAGTLGLSVRLLDPLTDLDTLDDVRAEWSRLKPLLGDSGLVGVVEAALR